ncbi:MAG: XylR N-terminal domain-containing protein [Crocinitomicaceae bacterium]|nr:XylR N-terminal domain-containing protein [Crocinitomicaceae bacterium]
MSKEIEKLKARIAQLEAENKSLRAGATSFISSGPTVSVPKEMSAPFEKAEELVREYFRNIIARPSEGNIEIEDERYVLLRASSLSVGFFNKIKDLYRDKGEEKSYTIGRNFLFDVSHVLGLEDAKNFHKKMKLKDPIQKLSAGPIHFAYTGWAFVDIDPSSNPSPDENFFMKYDHPFSFEADSWIKEGEKSEFPVCIMNAGYSSGWCEESFGLPLTAVELTCRAKGDDTCTFIMAPPEKIKEYLPPVDEKMDQFEYEIPSFFERKQTEERLKSTIEEKEVLLKEVHHRVKNNLQVISSLLNLQSYFITDEKTQNIFRDTKNRIKTLALVHERLFNSQDIEYVNLGEYVKSIVDLLSFSYDKEYIDIEYDFDSDIISKVDIEQAIPIGLLVNEIVSNSFKYAFPNILKGKITCSILKQNDKAELKICDDGIGLPKDLVIGETNSLGMELIQSLTSQIDGKLILDRDRPKGVCYTITF